MFVRNNGLPRRGAYFVISVLDEEENYIKTVYVFGDDKSWFSEMKAFWIHLRKK